MQGAERLAAMLAVNTTLRELRVGSCYLGVRGVLALTAAIAEHNNTLATLDLNDAALRSPPQDASPRHLARMLSMNGSLRRLSLSKQGVRDVDLEVMVAHGLVGSHSLQVLELRANCLSPSCAPQLTRLLMENSTVQVRV